MGLWHDVETKMQFHNGLEKIRRDWKKARRVERESHVDVFFSLDIEGVMHHEFLRQGQTVNR
jgi:hypothetical protein